MLKLYGADLSAPSNKVRFVANHLRLEYEYIKVSIRDGENRTPEYLKMHPAGKVPVVVDGGFVLFESDAISRYLARKEGSPLYPDDLKAQAIIDQWTDFTAVHIGAAMGRVLFNRVFAPVIGVDVDERSMQDGYNFLKRFLPVIDKQLKKSKYLASDQMTIADTALLANLDPFEIAEIDLSPYQAILSWRENLIGQEFYTKCHRNYSEVIKQVMVLR